MKSQVSELERKLGEKELMVNQIKKRLEES